jgi:hypothetical protein
MKPYYKPYPREVADKLNYLLPRFYRKVSESQAFHNRHVAASFLFHVAAISEGTYLVLPDAYGVLDYIKKYVDDEIKLLELWDEVKYILTYNGLRADVERFSGHLINITLPRRFLPLLRETIQGFMWDYPAPNPKEVKEVFRNHSEILHDLVEIIANFNVPGRLISALFFYVNGKTTTEQLLIEVNNILLTFKGLRPGLRF